MERRGGTNVMFGMSMPPKDVATPRTKLEDPASLPFLIETTDPIPGRQLPLISRIQPPPRSGLMNY
jgi:hypothetical protein